MVAATIISVRPGRAAEYGRSLRQWRDGLGAQARAFDAERDPLNRQIENRRRPQGEERRTWHRAPRGAHLAARRQRRLDAGESQRWTSPAVASTLLTGGSCCHAATGWSAARTQSQFITKPISGAILATVMNSIARALLRTPRTLITVNTAATTHTIRLTHVPASSRRSPSIAITVRANSTATAAPPNRPTKNSTAPAMKPINGPSAVST